MKPTVVCSLLLAGLCVVMTANAYAQEGKGGDAAKTVSGAGCVRAGVEAGCFVLTDTKTNKLYNLFFTGKPPDLNVAIRFDGEIHSGPTTCMQGTAVDVKKWQPIRMYCPKEK